MKIILMFTIILFNNPFLYAEDSVDQELSDEEWESVGGYPAVKGQEIEKAVRIEELIAPKVDYHYSPFGKTSPFAAPMVLNAKKPIELKKPSETPLTSDPLDAFKFVGIWRAKAGKPRTLIMTPRGVGIVGMEGMPIGVKEGKILKIFESRIVVREYEEKPDGTREYEDVVFDITGNSSGNEKLDLGIPKEKVKTSKKLSH